MSPQRAGNDCRLTASELARRLRASSIMVNGHVPDPEEEIPSEAFVTLTGLCPRLPKPPKLSGLHPPPHPKPPLSSLPGRPVRHGTVVLNGETIVLPPKADGTPAYVMDLLERTGIDFKHAQRPVILQVNGNECLFQQVLKDGDRVEIGFDDKAVES